MPKFCTKCGNKLEGTPSFCPECGHPLSDNIAPVITPVKIETKSEYQPEPQPGEIKCPFCSKFFSPPKKWDGNIKEQKKYSTSGNVGRGIVFLPWGIVRAIGNKPFLVCPHCKMKIPQG
ncbi:MAG: zinc ribbon domain-containing protein [Actinobacteria bacterium]|nr:zinc ribbon domain-containing protein [Actinomycetota bacterium]MBE3122636.1 zinc ribbon domain-containing protein [Thermoplasmata archaeon]